ncbi:MAG: flagellin, partial [Myxococcota bacterium]|nr:flagellin [Myxococcota bacterium]
ADRGSISRSIRNANEAISMLQTAEAGMDSIGDIYVRMRELAVEAATDSLTDTERGLLNTEFTDLREEAERIAAVTEYNGANLLDGTGGTDGGIVDVDGDSASRFFFQVGFQNNTDSQLEVQIKTQVIEEVQNAEIDTVDNARSAIDTLDQAFDASNTLHASRASVGAAISSLHTTLDFLHSQSELLQTAIGVQRDADVGQESMEFNRGQVLQNAGIAMLAQSNVQSNVALRLIG